MYLLTLFESSQRVGDDGSVRRCFPVLEHLFSCSGTPVLLFWNTCSTDITGHEGAEVKPSANRLEGTGLASQYWLQPRVDLLKVQWLGVRPLHPLLSH